MDWLKNLPVIGPLVARLMMTHAWRSYERLDRVHWSRLAAAITFISFLALFPLIAVGAAIGAALLSDEQLHKIEKSIADQVPGISDQLGISNLVANAGTVGLVAGALLLFTGVGWIGAMRGCLRAVWEKDDVDQGNPVVRKLKDAGLLIGLGGAALVTLAVSTAGSTAVGWTAGLVGIANRGAGGVLLQTAALLVAAVADFLLLLYLLTLLPGVKPPRRRLLTAAVIGAIGFELLKLLLGSYMKSVASKSMYGAFGVPVALLLWINFTARLLLFCAAWTATRSSKDIREGVADVSGEEAAHQVRQRPAPVDQEHAAGQQHQHPADDPQCDPDPAGALGGRRPGGGRTSRAGGARGAVAVGRFRTLPGARLRGLRGDQFADRGYLAGRVEAPVEARGLLVDGVGLLRRRVHDGDEQHLAVALGDACEGVARMRGVAVLDACDALVRLDAAGPGEQPVGVLDLEGPALLPLLLPPGKSAVAVEQYSRKSSFCSPLRANRVRSYALETCSGAS